MELTCAVGVSTIPIFFSSKGSLFARITIQVCILTFYNLLSVMKFSLCRAAQSPFGWTVPLCFFWLMLLTIVNPGTGTAQGCNGADGTGVFGGGISVLNNGQLCLNKSGAAAELRITISNVDESSPSFAVEIDWDDSSPRQIIAYGGGSLVKTAANTFEISSVTHTLLSRPCGARPGAECAYRPKVYLRFGGITCVQQFGTSPEIYRFNTDDQCSGSMGLTEMISGSNVYFVNPGATVTFTDRTTLNCLPPNQLPGVNTTKRWRQFVYGTTNTITGMVLLNGSPAVFPYTPSGMPEISTEPLSGSNAPFANNNTYSITIPATAQAGEMFHIRMDYWNFCNQYGVDPPVQEYGIIQVAGLVDQTIYFNALTEMTYGDSPFTLSAATSSGLPVTFSSSDTNVATVSGSTVTIVGAGTTTITASAEGNGVYAPATPVDRSLVVKKANLNVQANNKSKAYGDSNPALSVAFSGFKNGDIQSVLDNIPAASTTATSVSNAGSYPIVPSGGSDNNYSFTYVNGVLTVTKASLTVTAENTTRVYGSSNPVFSITYNGFVNGETASVLATPPSASTVADITSSVGSYPISVTGGTDENYTLAYANGTLTITKANQELAFTALTDMSETTDNFSLNAISSSGLPVTFTTEDGNKISINGSTATILNPGSVTITAVQTGSNNYEVAPPVSQTICINPSKPSITASGLDTVNPLLTSSSEQGNEWYLNGVLINNSTERTLTAHGDGSYQVRVTIEGCESELSDLFAIIITSTSDPVSELKLVVYPNPAQTELAINLQGSGSDDFYEINIYDERGSLIEKSNMSGDQRILRIGHYPAGKYYLQAVSDKGTLTGKFIKK